MITFSINQRRDPASYTSAFYNYLRTELNYKIDMPAYRVFAYDEPVFQKWDWGNAEGGFSQAQPAVCVRRSSRIRI